MKTATPRAAARYIIALSGCALLALGLLEGAARLAPLPLPDIGDLFLIWTAGREPVFTPAGGLVRTAAELVRLSNPPAAFSAVPAPGVIRIICIGDSTTAGWPVHPRGSYPGWLRVLLPDLLPGRSFEVINAGFHGFDSARALGVAAEALAYQPDLIVWRAGYNDYQMFPARHLPGRIATLALPARLWLTHHSRSYNLLRWVCGVHGDKAPGVPWLKPLSEPELAASAADYRRNLSALLNLTRSAGVPLVLLASPYRAAFDPRAAAADTQSRLPPVLRDFARESSVPLVALQEKLAPRRFIDNVHLDAEGYRITALALCRALAEHDILAPRRQWRWSRLRAAGVYARTLGLDDPEFASHLHVGLALFYRQRGDIVRAEAELTQAERLAPNPDMVFQEIAARRDPRILALLGTADRKLGFKDRAARANGAARALSP